MKLQVIRPITVKARVTDGLKQRLRAELQDGIKALESELLQLESMQKRAQLSMEISPQQQVALRQRLELERAQRMERKQELQEQIDEVGRLALGSEILQGTVQGLFQVEVGTNWADLDSEVLLEDDRVIAIRKV